MVVALLCAETVLGQVEAPAPVKGVEPPFNRKWGEAPVGLIDWAARFELDVLVKALGDRPRVKILVISARKGSLPNHESTSLEAHYIDGRLYELSVHYTYPGKSTEHVRARFGALKQILTKQFGALKFNGRKKAVTDGISTTSEAFHAEPKAGNMVVLALTEVQDTKREDAAARFSLLYHNDDILGGR